MGIKPGVVIGGGLMAASLGYVLYLGLASNWQYYLLVDECVARAEKVRDKRLRVSGRVAPGTLRTSAEQGAVFLLEGKEHRLPVVYQGTLPDNLAEGKEVLVEGTLGPDGQLQGQTIITKCASKYSAQQEAASAMDQRYFPGRP